MKRALALLLLAAAGCHEGSPLVEQNIQSLRITVDPGVVVGTEAMPNADRMVRLKIEAIDKRGQLATGFNATVQAYVFFLGTLTPPRDNGVGIQGITLTNGVADNVLVNLPTAFGPSSLWIEDQGEAGREPSYAAGATPILWYRDPYLSDVEAPAGTLSAGPSPANYHSILENKQIFVHTSQFGPTEGHLVVTSIGPQAYTVSDVQCVGGHAPCVSVPYGNLYVFTFSQPDPETIKVGTQIATLSGGISEFTGFTELNFPQQTVVKDAGGQAVIDPSLVPTPVVVTQAIGLDNSQMEGLEAGLVSVDGLTVCAPAAAADLNRWNRFGEFNAAFDGNCQGRNTIGLSTRPMSAFDPTTHDGLVLPHVVGWVRNVAGVSGSTGNDFSFWSVTIRDSNDLECSAPGCKGM